MPFILEDGTGVEGANSYVSSDFFKEYLKDRGRTSVLGGSAINAFLIEATDYVEARFLCSVSSEKLSEAQGLSLPTTDIAITTAFQSALVLYAEHLSKGNSLYSTQSERGPISRERSKVGPIEEELEYDTTRSTVGSTYLKIPMADVQMKKALSQMGILVPKNKTVIRH